jgi:threonine/homoserine/homoserine lactone efflux protein
MSAAFLITALVIVAVPGTGALLTIGAGVARGARASLITAVGCTLGIVPHLLAAITGTAALLRASGLAFEVLKLAGVCYLLALAVLSWRDRRPLTIDSSTSPRSPARMIVSAILANLLNPKLTLFFFAFLPQFVPSGGGSDPLPAMVELGLVFMAMTLVVFAVYGLAATAVRHHLIERPRVVRRMRRLFAASFVGLGVKLATESR